MNLEKAFLYIIMVIHLRHGAIFLFYEWRRTWDSPALQNQNPFTLSTLHTESFKVHFSWDFMRKAWFDVQIFLEIEHKKSTNVTDGNLFQPLRNYRKEKLFLCSNTVTILCIMWEILISPSYPLTEASILFLQNSYLL